MAAKSPNAVPVVYSAAQLFALGQEAAQAARQLPAANHDTLVIVIRQQRAEMLMAGVQLTAWHDGFLDVADAQER